MRGTERSYVSWGDSLQRSAAVGAVDSPSELQLGSLRGTESDDRPGVFDLTLLMLAVLAALASTFLLLALVSSGFHRRAEGSLPLAVPMFAAVWSIGLVTATWTSVVVAGRLLWRPVRRDVARLALLLFTPLAPLLLIPMVSNRPMDVTFFQVTSGDRYWIGTVWYAASGTLLLGLLPTVFAWVLLEQQPSVVTSPWHRWAVRVAGLATFVVVMPYGLSGYFGRGWMWTALRACMLLVGVTVMSAAVQRCRRQMGLLHDLVTGGVWVRPLERRGWS